MKANFKIFILAVLLALPMFTFAGPGPGVPPPPPPNPIGGGGTPVGGAPIENGTFILLTLAAAYAIRKVYESRKTTTEE